MNLNFADIPTSFKPNPLKTLRIKDRLIYNFNYQFGPIKNFYPTSIKADFSVGYKILYKWTLGAGVSYELGTGNGWSDISVSSKRFGLKSYLDFNISNLIFLEGGFERIKDLDYNYLPDQEIKVNGVQHSSSGDWFNRALLGLVIKKKITSKTQFTLSWLYDFLYNHHSPPSPAMIYRIGWQW